MTETNRPTTPAAEELLGLYFPVLDHGFVSLVDYMGGDADVARAARVSFGNHAQASVVEDRNLIRYLHRNRHCYAPEMEVLTVRGWVRWDACDQEETFLVPNPQNRSLCPEKLLLEVFSVEDETMACFKNDRMSYRVTSDHRMWFKKKFQGVGGPQNEVFEIVRANEMSSWGHFDPVSGYAQHPFDGSKTPQFQFIAFYLGDGSYGSTNRISFHLKKPRKKDYLRKLLQQLELSYTTSPSSTYPDAEVFWVETPNFMRSALGLSLSARSSEKAFPLTDLAGLKAADLRGLWDGLVNSDGHRREDRQQVNFSSTSWNLRALFEATSAMLGIATHVTGSKIGSTSVVAYLSEATSLEARKQYFTSNCFTGKVYCTTTSTGLLIVRGKSDEFGFVCGNTSPFEMVELKFHCSMPIFVARQWVRHRTASLNEFSGRYSVMPMLFYTPPAEQLRPQSKTNKQGREDGTFSDVARTTAYEGWRDLRETTVQHYEWLIANDFARELARIDLPLSTYTQWYWKIDLHNLLHFLTLRVDSHAQWEIQQFGKVMAGMLKRVAPLAYEAWVDYDVCGARLSRAELHVLRLLLRVDRVVRDTGVRFVGHAYGDSAVTAPEMSDLGMSKREVDEFCDRLEDGDHTTPDFSLDLSAAKPASYFEAEAATASKPRDTCGAIK